MNTQNSTGYEDVFRSIDNGMSYEDAARRIRISEDMLKMEHIDFSKRQPGYNKEIQKFTIRLIQDVGVYVIRVLDKTIEDLLMPEKSEFETVSEFFEARAEELVPYKYRATVKALAFKYVKELDRKN